VTIKIKVYLSIGFYDSIREEVLELDDGVTDEEIEEEVRDWKNNYIEWGWKKLPEGDEVEK